MIPSDAIIEATEERFDEATPLREECQANLAEFGPILATDSDRVFSRIQRAVVPELSSVAGLSPEMMEATIDSSFGLPDIDLLALERIIGANDMVSASFLAKELMAARPVGRIGVGSSVGPVQGWGTKAYSGPGCAPFDPLEAIAAALGRSGARACTVRPA